MEQIRNFEVFKPVAPLLKESLFATRMSLQLRVEAAKTLALDIKLLFSDNEKISEILSLPALNNTAGNKEYMVIAERLKSISLLEWILCVALEQSQDPANETPVRSSVGIMKRDMELISSYRPGERFDDEFEELRIGTNGFINILPHNSSARTDMFVFSFLCDFTKNYKGERALA